MTTETNERIIRDFAMIAALGSMMDESGVSTDEIWTDEEASAIDSLCDSMPESPAEYTEIVKRMFREAVDRLIVAAEGVTQTDATT